MKAKTLIGRRRFSRLLALRTSAPSAKHRHRNPKVKSMADTIQMDQGSAVPPRSEKEAERNVSRARKTAEDLSSAAGATADKYRPRGKVWDDALLRVRSFQDGSNHTSARIRRRRSSPRLGLVSCSVYFSVVRDVALRNKEVLSQTGIGYQLPT